MTKIVGRPITFGGGAGAPKIFGDGSDGVGLFTSNTTWMAETEDTGMIVKNFESLTISEGVTVSAGNRNCGMIVRVKGDCTIAGSLVNKLAPKSILDSDGVDFSAYPASMLNGVAGNGGAGGTSKYGSGAAGAGMTGRLYGGGWSGGGSGAGSGSYGYGIYHYGGNGGSSANITTAVADGSLFVGGASSTASNTGNNYGGAGTNGGGGGSCTNAGGNSSPGKGGSGAGGTGGAAGGAGYSYSGGGAGNIGGGVIILLVGGKLTITGTVDCSGGNGGNAGSANNNDLRGAGAGGAGGGRIFICHKGDISNTGTLNVNGGAAGTGSGNGTAGTIGTTAVKTYEQYMEEDVA